jgi:hypothetical protein
LASGTIEADSKENATTSVSQDEEQTTVSSQGYLTITAVPTKPPPAMLIHVCILPERYIPIVCYTRYPLFEPSRDIDWLLILREKEKEKAKIRAFAFSSRGWLRVSECVG